MKIFNIKISIIFLLLTIPITQSVWSGVSGQGKISVENSSWDFGFIPIDYKFIHIYKIKNLGDGNLHIKKLIPNCDCTIAIPSDTLIRPDSTIEIKIIFDTKNYYGQNNRVVTVHSDDPENPTIKLEYSSNIGLFPKQYKVAPISLFFLPGHKLKTAKLINFSDDDLEFSVETEPDSYFSVEKLSGEVKAKKEVSLSITPNENLPKGTYYSSFRVKFNIEPKAINITVPVKIVRY
jgi:hypothetical protein